MICFYYQSQQYIPKKKEEELVPTKEDLEKAPDFDQSSDEASDDDAEEIRKLENYQKEFLSDRNNLCFAGQIEEIKETQAVEKKKAATAEQKVKPEEKVREEMKQVKEIPAVQVEKEADAEKMPTKCENCDTVRRHNNKLMHNMNRLKESYDVLNKLMNQYRKSSDEQEIAI
ncbi:hypothetical protein Hanom_Chr07g00588261 [Helianthus anomalus]